MRLQDNNVLRLARVWVSLAKISIIREMEFRANFLLGIIRQFLWLLTFLFSISVVFQHTQALHGWSKGEVILILALSRLFEGILDIAITPNISQFPSFVQKGSFDYIVTKPLPAQLYTAFRTINIYVLGNVMAGIGLLVWVITSGSIHIELQSVPVFIWVSSMGLIIFYSILVTTASLAFFLERLEALWGLMNLYTEPLTVPIDIFPRVPRLLFTYIIPIAFIVFVPAQALVGKVDWHTGVLATGIAIVSLTIANIAWRTGISRYTSASS